MLTNKSTIEKIIEMLCNGEKLKDIKEKFNLTTHDIDYGLNKIPIPLPHLKTDFVKHREAIRANMKKYKKYKQTLAKLDENYYKSLTNIPKR